jgi:hypothetical protein
MPVSGSFAPEAAFQNAHIDRRVSWPSEVAWSSERKEAELLRAKMPYGIFTVVGYRTYLESQNLSVRLWTSTGVLRWRRQRLAISRRFIE